MCENGHTSSRLLDKYRPSCASIGLDGSQGWRQYRPSCLLSVGMEISVGKLVFSSRPGPLRLGQAVTQVDIPSPPTANFIFPDFRKHLDLEKKRAADVILLVLPEMRRGLRHGLLCVSLQRARIVSRLMTRSLLVSGLLSKYCAKPEQAARASKGGT